MENLNKNVHFIPRLLRSKKFIILLVLVVAGLAAWSGYNHYFKAKDLVFTVEGDKYYKKDVNQLTKFLVERRGYSQDKAARSVMADLKKIKAAQELGIKPSDKQINLQKSILLNGLDNQDKSTSYNPWFELEAKKDAVDAYVGNTYKQDYKGYSYVFYFGQHLQYGSGYKPSGLNDPSLVAKDKDNAKERADYYHDKIESGGLSPDVALKQILNDPKIVTSQDLILKQSSKFGFNPNTSWYEDIVPDDVKSFVNQQQKAGLSSIQIGKAAQAPGDSKDKYVDMYYYFTSLDEVDASKTAASQQFNAQLSKVATDYKGFN